MRPRVFGVLFFAAVGLAVAACGGGSKSTSPVPPAVGSSASQPQSASRTYPLSTSAASYDLPPLGSLTGHIAMPSAAVPAKTTLTLVSSLSAPNGATFSASRLRNPKSGSLTIFYYTTITLSADVTLPGLPGFSLTLPASLIQPGAQYFYAVSDPTVTNGTLQFRTEGPASVSGNTVTFAGDTTPLTIKAGLPYIVAFYAVGGAVGTTPTPNPCGSPASSYAGEIDLSPGDVVNPTGPSACAARFAFKKGSVIVLRGGTEKELGAALDLNIPTSSAKQQVDTIPPPASTPSPDSTPTPIPVPTLGPSATPLTLEVLAVHQRPRGAVHSFHGWVAASGQSGASLQQWIQKEQSLVTDTPQPPAQAWFELSTDQTSLTDANGNAGNQVTSVYRLNTLNTQNDWYLVSSSPTTTPHYVTCAANGGISGGNCFWYSGVRSTAMSTFDQLSATQLNIVEHGPGTTPSTSNASFSIGGTLTGDLNPAINPIFTASWSQASVSTVDNTMLTLAHWVTNFASWSGHGAFYSAPPANTTSTYTDDEASIFISPANDPSLIAGTSFNFTYRDDTDIACLIICFVSGGTTVSTVGGVYSAPISLPTFAIAPSTTVTLQPPPSPNASTQVSITSNVPGGAQNVGWTIANVPSWLTVSQLSGAGDTTVTLTVNPNTASGSVADLNFNTDPPYAAPSVRTGPLVLTVCVDVCPSTRTSSTRRASTPQRSVPLRH